LEFSYRIGFRALALEKQPFLEVTLRELIRRGFSVGAIVGDLETDRDAMRLSRSGALVRQIMTHGCCHLEADMIEREIAQPRLDTMDFLFIENVGNLVCPTSWDLGESLRIALPSVTEGEDKPLKYPRAFQHLGCCAHHQIRPRCRLRIRSSGRT